MAAGVTAGLLAATVANPIDAITVLYNTPGWSVFFTGQCRSVWIVCFTKQYLLYKTVKICLEHFLY